MGGNASSLGKRYGRQTKYTKFGNYGEALAKSTKWFADPNNSNSEEWLQNLADDESRAIRDYTGESGIDYKVINGNLYTKEWDDIPNSVKERITAMDNAMNKSLLLNGMMVTRQCDFKIFGAESGERMTIDEIKAYIKKEGIDNTLENKGYLSFGANNHGASIDGSGLVIHAKIPPSQGAGAYVNPISKLSGAGENEFLLNRGANLKYDLSSLKMDSNGRIHINATWVPGKKKKKR